MKAAASAAALVARKSAETEVAVEASAGPATLPEAVVADEEALGGSALRQLPETQEEALATEGVIPTARRQSAAAAAELGTMPPVARAKLCAEAEREATAGGVVVAEALPGPWAASALVPRKAGGGAAGVERAKAGAVAAKSRPVGFAFSKKGEAAFTLGAGGAPCCG